jgi:hypothetical protein
MDMTAQQHEATESGGVESIRPWPKASQFWLASSGFPALFAVHPNPGPVFGVQRLCGRIAPGIPLLVRPSWASHASVLRMARSI